MYGPEGMMVSCGSGTMVSRKTVPALFVPPPVSRAIETAVAALHQSGIGICAIMMPLIRTGRMNTKLVSAPLVLILNTVP